MCSAEASGVVLDSKPMGEWQVQSIKSDAIEQVMPLTRSGLPEHLQGLVWMDQWGVLGGSNIGSKESLLTSGPDYMDQKKGSAQPDLVMSFAGMPFETIGDKHVSLVAVDPTDAGNWSWFGITRDHVLNSFKEGADAFVYKFIFNAEWTECYIVPTVASGLPETLRFTMSYAGDDVWHRKTYMNAELTGDTFHYTAYRIVDGAGNRLSRYSDYLATANLPEVSGTVNPESVVIVRRPGATDNAQITATLPQTGAWPEWSEKLLSG